MFNRFPGNFEFQYDFLGVKRTRCELNFVNLASSFGWRPSFLSVYEFSKNPFDFHGIIFGRKYFLRKDRRSLNVQQVSRKF